MRKLMQGLMATVVCGLMLAPNVFGQQVGNEATVTAQEAATIRKVTVTVTIGDEDKEKEGDFNVTVTTAGGLELFDYSQWGKDQHWKDGTVKTEEQQVKGTAKLLNNPMEMKVTLNGLRVDTKAKFKVTVVGSDGSKYSKETKFKLFKPGDLEDKLEFTFE